MNKPEKIYTIGELRKAISEFNDDDIVVVEIHEGIRGEDLYEFDIDVIDGVKLTDGTTISEVRICI
jgi:hypothetical protein